MLMTDNTATQICEQRDNGNYCKQVKVSVATEVASAFKAKCDTTGVSMASVLSQFMAEYVDTAPAKRKLSPDYSTKRHRRAAVRKLVGQLELIRCHEEQYRDNIPENLRSSAAFDAAEEFVSCINEAIDALDLIDSS
jgi:hypothetical protein